MRYLLLLVVIISCKAKKENLDCERFRAGVYSTKSEVDSIEYIITRSDSIQTETNTLTDAITKAKITWTGPCTYELLHLSYEGGSDTERDMRNNESFNEFSKTPVKVTIVHIAEDYFIFEAKAFGYTMMDTMHLIQ